MVRSIVSPWAQDGLHPLVIGESRFGDWRTRSFYREEMLLRAIPLFVEFRGKSCLDLACNNGFWSFRLAPFGISDLTGIDLLAGEVARANFLKTVYNFPRYQFYHRDLFEFLYLEKRRDYDVVLMLSVLYHLPEGSDWNRLFETLARITRVSLVIDTRWFDQSGYYYDTTTIGQSVIQTEAGAIPKWRPTRQELVGYLKRHFERIIEIHPGLFRSDLESAHGSGDPYSDQNVSDYLTHNRSLLIAYKKDSMLKDPRSRFSYETLS